MADANVIEVEINALGARALALILKHEWCGIICPDVGCPECRAIGGLPHRDKCEWAAIVADAEKLQGDPK